MIRFLLSRIFKAMGFKYINDVPEGTGSFVAIGAPHTSNWDFVTSMSIMHYTKMDNRFLIKHSWTKFPLSLFFKPLGAVGINRTAIKEGTVSSTTDDLSVLFKENSNVALWIAPEGTRSLREKWKTGFYYIALKAEVPIVCGYADWKTKTAGLGRVIHPSGDMEADMKLIMDFYRPMEGCVNEKFSVDLRY